jgi:hypothetical protein
MFEDAFVPNPTTHSYLSARFIFPPNLVHVSVSMPGREGLVMADGMVNLGVNLGWNSQSLRAYHSRLVREGLYDRDFDFFAPNRKANNRSYDQVLIVPLKNYDIPDASQLQVVMKYNDGLSQARWYLHAVCLVQKILSCDSQNKWEWKDV